MRSAWALGVLVASGCSGGAPASPVLRVEPASIDLDVELGQPAPIATVQVFSTDAGSDVDVTGDATFALDGARLGAITDATLTSDGLTGGAATLLVGYGQAVVQVPVTAHLHSRRIAAGVAPGAADAFATAAVTPIDANVNPGDGVVLPASLGRMAIDFAAADLDDTHQIEISSPYLDIEVVAPGIAGPREVELSPGEWAAVAHTASGGGFELSVASLQSSAPATARVATSGLEVADLAPSALVISGAIAASLAEVTDGSTNRPSLWRYDMQAGAATSMFANPTGACIGCHLAVSADGSRIAALIVSPTAPNLNGVVLDQHGNVMAQSVGTSATPWATAAFDPDGALLAAWQGGLSLRDADTGAVLAPITMTEAAAAPTISPDGTAVAYVSLDAGFGDAASQPIGNALHVRPWNASSASLGPVVELARSPNGVVLPEFSPDGRWIAYAHGTPDPTRLNEVPTSAAAVRSDGSGTIVPLTVDPLDKLAHWASPIAPARSGNRAAEPMVWIGVVSSRAFGGNPLGAQQLWLEAFFPDRGVVAPAFHLPGQPAQLQVIHGPIALP